LILHHATLIRHHPPARVDPVVFTPFGSSIHAVLFYFPTTAANLCRIPLLCIDPRHPRLNSRCLLLHIDGSRWPLLYVDGLYSLLSGM
jgi:hypothetical protein